MKRERIWSKGSFAETMGPWDREKKKRTFSMKHDEEMNFSCSECGKKISAHNRDWHDNMCDDCFNGKYFPEDAQIYETDIDGIKKSMKLEKKDNMSFWRWLKTDELDFAAFNKIVKEVTEKIDCTKCGNCCREISPVLREEDIKRISEMLKISRDEFIKEYTKTDEDDIIFNLPCPFLKENKCSVYEARPDDCRNFPNLDKDIASRCHAFFFSNAGMCPIVFNVLQNAKEEFLEDIYEFENMEA